MKNKPHYSEPKGRVFDNAQNFRNVVVIGEDQNGETQIWSSLDEQRTSALIETAGLREPAQG